MELRVLQYFLAIAREQSIVRAAESLHLSQPTLSTQIKNLEEELGKQLLIRGTKGSRKITLTEEGMILRKRAEEILDLVNKTETEITLSDSIVMGDVYIGTGEADSLRFIAKAAKQLQKKYPGIHYHILSGNSRFVQDHLDTGLIDFGIIFEPPDLTKYNAVTIPQKNVWGVLMRKDAPLAKKKTIKPEDLYDKPLLFPVQEASSGRLAPWMQRDLSTLNIVVTYNLMFNASLFVEEGVGYAVGLDDIICTAEHSNLCFRPFSPPLENEMHVIWKRYKVFSKPAEKFIEALQKYLKPE